MWTELLKKFTNVTDEVAEKGDLHSMLKIVIDWYHKGFLTLYFCLLDEPILSYQRSSFFPVSEEKRVGINDL